MAAILSRPQCVNTVTANGRDVQGATASAAMVLAYVSEN